MVETVKTKKVIEVVDTTITVKFPYSKEIVSSVKELGFLRYNPIFKYLLIFFIPVIQGQLHPTPTPNKG